MSIVLNQQALHPNGVVGERTHGSRADRFGGAYRSGMLHLYQWHGVRLEFHKIKCSTYRKAQRKLLQWLKGYNV